MRAEKANLLGFENFAAYKLDDTMAKTPDQVRELLTRVWAPAVTQARDEEEKLAELAQRSGENHAIEPWDWRFYSEKVRKEEHDLDEAELKPYLQLDNIIQAAFDTATRLFGVSFRELEGLPVYHPDVRVFEVLDKMAAIMLAVPGRLFRSVLQTFGRLDERLPLAAQTGWQRHAGHRQRDEFFKRCAR